MNMEILKAKDLVPGEKYRFISPISGEVGMGSVEVIIDNGERRYKYFNQNNSFVDYVRPCALTKFMKAQDEK